jgi:hypothetical protein
MSKKESTPAPVQEEEMLPKMKTAFVIAIADDGRVFLERNTEALKLEVDREATLIEVRRYLSEILMDLQAQAAAEYTIGALMAAQPPSAPAE